MGKGFYEAMVSDIKMVENEIVYVTTNLPKWAKDEKAPDIDFVNSLVRPGIRKDPLGCVLVIGSVYREKKRNSYYPMF